MKTRIENLREVHRIDYHTGKFESCNFCLSGEHNHSFEGFDYRCDACKLIFNQEVA